MPMLAMLPNGAARAASRAASRAAAHALLAAVVAVSSLSAVARAQSSPSSMRITVASRAAATANVCEELASWPSTLAQAPEGLALLRLKRELEGAAQTLARTQQLQEVQVRALSQVQREVDSAMQVVVRSFGVRGAPDEVVTIRRTDSTRVTVQGRPLDARSLFITVDSSMRVMAREMGPTLGGLVRALQPQVAALTGAAEAQILAAAPGGYMGLSLSGAQLRLVTPEGVMTSHCEYPLIESVDTGSPAERAGLVSGDTLLAYNGRDVLQLAVNYPDMLAPGSTVRVRVRKGGRPREVPVTVSARTDERRGLMMVRELPTPMPTVRSAPFAPTASAGVAMLAGAQWSTIDEEFAATLELEAGVLALRVPPGTPAADAGVRAGEVVVRVNGQRVRDVGALRRMLARGGEARLVVQSRTGERTVVLKLR